ncbi:MAG TPA: LOG family protein [Candidatus Eremiobacteraceae bacterium]|nr:LOG family protein [Candidatus Eremiobacteraceae bacterium]
MHQKIISVFGSSRPATGDTEYEQARTLGSALAERGFAVCTGGYGGVMEATSRGAKEAGGKTYGVTAEFFSRKANDWVDVEIRKKTWAERLFTLIEMGDGFVVCKGGTGTLVELAVVWEMLNKRAMPAKPCVVLGLFWQPILERVREVELATNVTTGSSIWGEANRTLVHSAPHVDKAVEFLVAQLAPGKKVVTT